MRERGDARWRRQRAWRRARRQRAARGRTTSAPVISLHASTTSPYAPAPRWRRKVYWLMRMLPLGYVVTTRVTISSPPLPATRRPDAEAGAGACAVAETAAAAGELVGAEKSADGLCDSGGGSGGAPGGGGGWAAGSIFFTKVKKKKLKKLKKSFKKNFPPIKKCQCQCQWSHCQCVTAVPLAVAVAPTAEAVTARRSAAVPLTKPPCRRYSVHSLPQRQLRSPAPIHTCCRCATAFSASWVSRP